MSDYFYYFGILYVLDLLYNIWDSFKPEKEENLITFHTGIPLDEMMERSKKALGGKENILHYIKGTVFLLWLVVGYVSNSDEKSLFFSDIILHLSRYSLMFLIGVFSALKAFSSQEPQNLTEKLSSNLSKFFHIFDLLIVLTILYLHFFTH